MSGLAEIRRLTVEYPTASGPFVAVEDFDLDIGRGEIVGLAGESGSGKSTVAFAIMRLLRPPARVTAGRILVDGEDVLGFDEQRLAAWRWRTVSMVFQSAMNALNPVTTVFAQFRDVLACHLGLDRGLARRHAEALLDLVGIPAARLDDYPHQLSGGMRQRVVLAIALALEPKLIVMDEPTTALDVVVQREILNEIVALKARLGFSILFITHDLPLLSEFADRICVMREGEAVETAVTDEMIAHPRHAYTKALWAAAPIAPPVRSPSANVHPPPNAGIPAFGSKETPKSETSDFGAERDGSKPQRRHLATKPGVAMTGEAIIALDRASKTFRIASPFGRARTVEALRGVSFHLDKGKALALVGESGSGKTTCARAIAGLIGLTSGRVLFQGRDIAGIRGRAARLAFAGAVQIVFQDPFSALNPTHTLRHHLARPLKLHGRVAGDPEAEIRRALKEVELDPDAAIDKYPHELSGGELQRVNLARALAVGAELIVADEPTSMLDVSIRRSVLDLMRRLKETHGIAFVFVTHDIATANYFAEETAVMLAGRIVEQGPSAEVMRAPQHPYTRLLLSALPRIGKRMTEAAQDFTARAEAIRTATRESGDLVEWRPGHLVREAATEFNRDPAGSSA